MSIQRRPSWEIRSGIDDELSLVLYVRDAAGLGRYVLTDPDLPPLSPAVPVYVDDIDLRLAIRQWERWWARAVRPSLDRPRSLSPDWAELRAALADIPAMKALTERLFDDFRAWSRGRHDEANLIRTHRSLALVRFVNDHEQTLGRPVRRFMLVIRELPVEGLGGWVLDRQHVLVSTALTRDAEAFRAFLAPVIARLA